MVEDTMHFEDGGVKLPSVAAAPRATPPYAPRAAGVSGRSTWPTVLGIVAIVLGAFGFLSGALSLVSTLFIDSFLSSLPTSPNVDPAGLAVMEAIRSAARDWAGVLILTQLARALVPVVLLVGGILLVQRRRASMPTLRTWAVLQAIALPVRIVGGYLILQQAVIDLPGAALRAWASSSGWPFPCSL